MIVQQIMENALAFHAGFISLGCTLAGTDACLGSIHPVTILLTNKIRLHEASG